MISDWNDKKEGRGGGEVGRMGTVGERDEADVRGRAQRRKEG